MSATAGTLTLLVDSRSVSDGERSLDSIARTGARVEGSLTINMGSIEKAMERLGQKVTSLNATMTSGMGRMSAAGNAQAKTFEALRASIDPAYAASMRYKEVQQQLAAMVSSGEASQRAANIVLEQAASRYMGVATASERAAEAERKAALSTAASKQNYEQLRASLDPLYATSKKFEAAIETLNAAQKAGVISDIDRARTLDLLEEQMIQTDTASLKAAGGVGKFGLVANQVGYQVQDVFVSAPMVGWFRAVAQQAPQAAGAFSMLGGSIGTFVPWVGTAIAVGAALAPMLFGTAAEAKNLDDRFSDLSESTSAYAAAVTAAQRSISDLHGEFGALAVRAREVLKVQRELAEFAAVQSQKAAISGVVDEFGRLTNIISLSNEEMEKQLDAFARYDPSLTGARATRKEFNTLAVAVNDITDELGISQKAAVAFAVAMRGAANADDPEARAAALAKARNALMAAAKEQGGLNDLGAKYVGLLSDAELAALAAAAGTAKAAGETNNWADAMFGVKAEIVGIISALSQIGGGVISNAAKQVEIDALKMGKSLQEALQAKRDFEVNAEFDQKIAGAGTWMEAQALKVQKSVALVGLELDKEANALRKAATATKKAAGASAKATKETERQLDAIRDSLSPISSYNKKLAELSALQDHLSDQEMAQAIRNLNVELADSLPLVGELTDTLAEGLLNGFRGSLSDIGDMFKRWLAQMIATAAKNRIMIGLGFGGATGLAGTAASAATGGGFFGNLLGSGLGGGAMSGLWSGLGGVLSGGGLGSSFANLGGLLTGASSGLGAIGAAIPAIGLVAAGFSLLIGRTRELDSGLRVTVDGFDSLVETFSVVERSRLFGLIRSRRTNLSVADAAIADPVALAVAEIQGSVLDMAGVLDIGRAAFDGFATSIDISTSGMSDDEAAEAIQEQLIAIADQMSEVALAGFEVVNAGETASEALSRLSSSLTAVTTASDALGHSFDEAGVLGAALASSIVEAFGGLEAYSTATGRYFELFYTEEERRAALTRQATDALAALNVAMPQSRAEYQAIIEALDLTTDAGRNAYAALIGMADVMDSILPSVQNFTDMMAALVGSTSSVLDQMISESNSMMRSAETAAANWYRASETIKDLVSDILNANTATVAGQDQARRYNLSQYETALAAARGGDVDAARNIPALASAYLNSVENTAGTYAEFQAAQARVLGDARFLSGIAALEGANQDVMVTLYQEQIGILQDVYDYLSTTDTIDPDDISSFESQLNSLQAAIEAAELFSYDYLRERLRVTVDLLATADIPEAIQTLIQSAATGIDATINFAVYAPDLTPDLRWLALNGASEHLSTIDFALGNTLSAETIELALLTSGSVTRTIRAVMRNTLSHDEMLLALAGSSELARVVNVALGSGSSEQAIQLALGNVGSYAVNVRAALTASAQVRQIVFGDTGSYAAMIEAAFSADLTPAQRRVLLRQQGAYSVNILATLSQAIPDDIRALILNANTSAIRAITIATAFADSVDPDELPLLLEEATEVLRLITFGVNPTGVTPFDVLLLDVFTSETDSVVRTIKGKIDASEVWNQNFWKELRWGEPVQTRTIKGKVNVADVWQNPYWQDLRDGPEWRTRGIVGQVNVAGVWKNAYWQDLRDGETWRTRGMTAAINVSQVWQNPFWAELRDGETWQLRGITGAVDASSVWSNGFWAELRQGQTWRTRGIEAAIDVSDVWQNAFWRDLRNGAEWRTRGITAQIDVSDVWRNAFWQELRDGSEWQVRGITGLVNASSVWSNSFWQELRTGAEWRTRGIVGQIDVSNVWQNRFWAELRDGADWRTRGIVGAVDASGVWSTALWSELRWGSEWRTRGLRGAVDVSAVWQTNYWRELLRGDEWRQRGLTGLIDLGQLTGDEWDFFDALREGSTTIERIIEGVVDLSGLNNRQRSLLDMIRGTSTGTVTLGGSFVFDPSESFTTWWESTTTDTLTTPMSVLTDALSDLREATLENIATMREVQLSSYLASLTTNNRGMTFMDEAEIRTVAEMMGIDQSDVTLGNLMWRIAQNSRTDALERVIYDPTGAKEARFLDGLSNDHASGYTRSDFSITRQANNPWVFDVTGPMGGVQHGLSYDQAYSLMDDVITGVIPAFATGGTHAGGLRLVGENGPELEATGPSRIYSASQTKDLLSGGGSDLSQKVHDMTEELKALRSENTQLLARIYRADRDTAKRLERLEKTGFPTKDYVE